jgi:hypothetical protein
MSADLRCSKHPEQPLMALPSWDWIAAYGGSAVELGGFAIGAALWKRLARGQRVVTLWFAAAAVSDILVIVLARRHQSTQPVTRVWFAASVILALEALAAYQHDARRVLALRILAVMYVATSVVLLVTIEPLTAITTYAAPLHALVILTAAVVTLLRRATFGRGELVLDPGFLIATGLIGYAVAAVFETLVAQLWVIDFPQYVKTYFAACDIVTALAEIVIIMALFRVSHASLRRSW